MTLRCWKASEVKEKLERATDIKVSEPENSPEAKRVCCSTNPSMCMCLFVFITNVLCVYVCIRLMCDKLKIV